MPSPGPGVKVVVACWGRTAARVEAAARERTETRVVEKEGILRLSFFLSCQKGLTGESVCESVGRYGRERHGFLIYLKGKCVLCPWVQMSVVEGPGVLKK